MERRMNSPENRNQAQDRHQLQNRKEPQNGKELKNRKEPQNGNASQTNNKDYGEETIHETLRSEITEYISNMNFSYGTKLLSENQLAIKFHVGRAAVRAVLDELETEGKIIRKQGSGTYVNTRAIMMETTIYPRMEMRSIIEKNGFTVTSATIRIDHIRAGKYAELLNCRAEDIISEAHSLYYADGRACMYCIDRMAPGILSDEDWMSRTTHERPLYDTVREKTDTAVAWDIMRFFSVCCSDVPEIASYLKNRQEENQSLTRLEILNYSPDSRPLIYGNIYVNTDLIQLNLIRNLTKL